jgi:hypothetical protein
MQRAPGRRQSIRFSMRSTRLDKPALHGHYRRPSILLVMHPIISTISPSDLNTLHRPLNER